MNAADEARADDALKRFYAEQRDSAELLFIDGLVVDERTGEVVDWPAGAPEDGPERIAYLVQQALGAQQAERDSKAAYDAYRRAIGRLLGGERALDTEYGRAVAVAAGEVRTADARRVEEAVRGELLTNLQASSLLLRAAKTLDADEVLAWIEEVGDLAMRGTLRMLLISTSPRSGYVRLYPPKARPPRVERRAKVEAE